jgi:hypothetical protein
VIVEFHSQTGWEARQELLNAGYRLSGLEGNQLPDRLVAPRHKTALGYGVALHPARFQEFPN